MARFLKSRKNAYGKAPGSHIFIGKQKMDKCRIRVVNYDTENIQESDLDNLEQLSDYQNNNGVLWLNIDGLHDSELIDNLANKFSVSSLAMEDILNTDHRPKYTETGSHIVIILKSFFYVKDDEKLHSEQISFILGDNYLITIQERVGDHFEPVRRRLRSNIGRIRKQKADYLTYALIDTLIDSYLLTIENIGQSIEALEEIVLNKTKQDIIRDIYNRKTDISFLRKSIRPMREIVTHLNNTDSVLISSNIKYYVADLSDLIIHANESIDVYFTMISDQLNIYNTNLSNRVNDVMKVLTIFASIFIPLTFIAGIYGTNFDYLPELHFKYSYFIMLGLMLMIAGAMLYFFKKKKWF